VEEEEEEFLDLLLDPALLEATLERLELSKAEEEGEELFELPPAPDLPDPDFDPDLPNPPDLPDPDFPADPLPLLPLLDDGRPLLLLLLLPRAADGRFFLPSNAAEETGEVVGTGITMTGSNGGVGTDVVGTSDDGRGDGDGIVVVGVIVVVVIVDSEAVTAQ